MHWPIFEDEKGEIIEIGDVNFYKRSCCDEQFAPKKGWGQSSEYNTECIVNIKYL